MDKYDEQAKDLLTMRSLNEAVEAVAAALRELGKRKPCTHIEQLEEKCNAKDGEYMQRMGFAEGVIADLPAQADGRKSYDQLQTQLSEAEKRGMERAWAIADGICGNAAKAIRAAMEKNQSPKNE